MSFALFLPGANFLLSLELSVLCVTGHLVQGSLGIFDTDTSDLDSYWLF